jgi:hypothetical protein
MRDAASEFPRRPLLPRRWVTGSLVVEAMPLTRPMASCCSGLLPVGSGAQQMQMVMPMADSLSAQRMAMAHLGAERLEPHLQEGAGCALADRWGGRGDGCGARPLFVYLSLPLPLLLLLLLQPLLLPVHLDGSLFSQRQCSACRAMEHLGE